MHRVRSVRPMNIRICPAGAAANRRSRSSQQIPRLTEQVVHLFVLAEFVVSPLIRPHFGTVLDPMTPARVPAPLPSSAIGIARCGSHCSLRRVKQYIAVEVGDSKRAEQVSAATPTWRVT